ncbi:MAG: RdgB/HAM1 family non-canonical purine NTP pyrophosphatase [Gammaproteobacteria bacterium]|nr:RdgB/HAM1 family non-canonical purine NTP pyrophosphatase [Gammaproteobacteria bacterium]MDH4256075.1 RdgB/HAM1 family non-canonical purine NTP pyrophosphatase [Gammaproteobacteria bacterium]MDH5311409.1 RdgB/HAM1 family non-canonical purine NTP pyrophosphatase [Gammaproteobacteria bacterium]
MPRSHTKIVIATGNRGKLREIASLLADLGVEVVAQADLGVAPPEETGTTFVENALQKARHAARATGLPAIADDSGLVVAALDGRPGVWSARYAGPAADDAANNAKLLRELEGVRDRSAHFHCAAVFVRDENDPEPVITEASWHGEIAAAEEGTGGFGYDPLFRVPGRGCTSAELTAEEKNALSHRGQAMRALHDRLRAKFRA